MFKQSLLLLVTTSLALSSQAAQAAELTEAQRKKLNLRLEKIINKSEKALSSRQATAYKAYKGALSSNSAALALYYKCVEKVDFKDAGKKGADFRNWKRSNKERHSEAGFRIALRHQLNWLVLTIDASRNKSGSFSKFTPRATSAINKIFDDAKALGAHNGILRQSAISSVFARAYGFGNFQVKDWPMEPLNITNVYERLILPPLREAKKASKIRSAWMKRISYEELMIEHWGPKPKGKSIGMKKAIASPALTKFISEKRPSLIWAMELDVFKAGDQSGAATRMIEHISKHHAHNDATKWAKELSELLAPKESQAEDNLLTNDEINNFDTTEEDE